MKKTIYSILIACSIIASPFSFADDDVLGKVDTSFNTFGANDHIEIRRFSDPDIDGITCHISSARKGGVKASFGLAEDASNASVACRQTGPISFNEKVVEKQKEVFTQKRSALFKKLHVVRMHDKANKTFVYLVYSDKLIDGSPKNAISSVPYYNGYSLK